MLNTICKSWLNKYAIPILLSQHYLLSPTSAFAQNSDDVVKLSPLKENSVSIHRNNSSRITVPIQADDIKDELLGNIPAKFISDHPQLSFQGNRKSILWHDKNTVSRDKNSEPVFHDPTIYLDVKLPEDIDEKNVSIVINKEANQSRAATLAAFFPQLIPVMLVEKVAFSPAPTYFYDTLMRWNFKVLGADLSSLVRNVVSTRVFNDKKELLSQCTADFVEAFVLFEAANYGESIDEYRGRMSSFRITLATAPLKKVMDCMASTVSTVLSELNDTSHPENIKTLNRMNQKSIDGISQLLVGYGFNIFAYEASDLFGSIKKSVGLSRASDMTLLQNDIDRATVKAAQYTLQEGYEKFFEGQFKAYNLNENYSYLAATGAGIFEMFLRLHLFQNRISTPKERTHQLNSFTTRAEVMGLSFNNKLALPQLTDYQLLGLGITLPLVTNMALSMTSGFYSAGTFALLNNLYEGLTFGAVAYLLSPVLQKYGVNGIRKIQKPVLDYLNAGSGSLPEYILAEDVIYRVNLVIKD